MGMIDFVKSAGEKLFGHGQAQAAMVEVKKDPANDAKIAAANSAAGDAILDYIKAQNLSATGLTVTFDGASSTASVFGVAPDQATREKIVLCCGNVAGVGAVKDMMTVDQSAAGGDLLHGRVRRQPLEDLQGELRRSEQVHGDLRGQQADALRPEQDLPGPGAAHSAAVMDVGFNREALAAIDWRAGLRTGMGAHDIPHPIGDPDEDEELPGRG